MNFNFHFNNKIKVKTNNLTIFHQEKYFNIFSVMRILINFKI